MKQSYCRSGIFRILQTFGVFLTSLTLLSSCSNELEGFSSEQKEDNVTSVSTKDDSVLRFKTIDELENISIKDIPGDNDGFELKELSYECVDTIELRALRFDVKAKLASSSNQERVIGFAAEVGPELVSVEYYPSVEVVPAHDNMIHCAYPKVERYRNYSDGSRIGPDEFYDYGHFIQFQIRPSFSINVGSFDPYGNLDCWAALLDYDFDEGYRNTEDCYEKGTFYRCTNGFMKFNLNTMVIDYDGTVYTGEDFYPIIADAWKKYMDSNVHLNDYFSKFKGNYYDLEGRYYQYIPSRLFNTEDPDFEEFINIGRNAIDNSPTPYPRDVKNLQTGWYFAPIYDEFEYSPLLLSKYLLRLVPFYERIFPVVQVNYFYLQYLVVDGRIIHFDNLMEGYEGIGNLEPKTEVTKVADGYKLRAEIDAHIYGERFAAVFNCDVIGENGPEVLRDFSSMSEIKNKDIEELNKLSTRSSSEQFHEVEIIPRKDGKAIRINRQLPFSLENR